MLLSARLLLTKGEVKDVQFSMLLTSTLVDLLLSLNSSLLLNLNSSLISLLPNFPRTSNLHKTHSSLLQDSNSLHLLNSNNLLHNSNLPLNNSLPLNPNSLL